MRIFDAHCDTACEIFDKKCGLYENSLHFDIRRTGNYDGYTQVFAVYADPKHKDRILERSLEVIDYFICETDKNSDSISLCKNGNDMRDAVMLGKRAAFLALEGADAVTSAEILHIFYRLGVRVISPVWNVSNHIATSVTEENPAEGLTEFGKRIFKEMTEMGIIADVSHTSDRTFWDIMSISRLPVIATHSNSRTVSAHRRNLSDEQFTAVVRSGGCVGINLYPFFLSLKKEAAVDDIIRHIEHFCSIGGENNIGLGCDFDGVDILPEGISGIQDISKIFDTLAVRGYSDELINKIACANFERVFAGLD
ncbi:MAG: dipeptidase [Oscillospiraceae bacterium]|nr:dipeptidase [Oscillospiraceae bacterium]